MRLSKSTLEEYVRCPRCWWLSKTQNLKVPDGIRAGVPMGIDRVLKGHYDAHRAAKTVPPELVGKIPGGLYPGDRMSLADMRNWRKGLAVAVGPYELSTAFDDLLYNPATKLYNMFDAKSKAKLTNEEDTMRYYQTQADAYDLALNANGYPTDGWGYFAYYSPLNVAPLPVVQDVPEHTVVPFTWNCQVVRIRVDHARIRDLVARAGKCLEGKLPDPSENCLTCAYIDARTSYLKGAV
jgi:hypothetical protein